LTPKNDSVSRPETCPSVSENVHRRFAAQVSARRVEQSNGQPAYLCITVEDFVSPAIQQLLKGRAAERVGVDLDWRCVVDRVMIDPAYDGRVLRVVLADIPAKLSETVSGSYKLPASGVSDRVAVKIVDILGEEVIVTVRPKGEEKKRSGGCQQDGSMVQ